MSNLIKKNIFFFFKNLKNLLMKKENYFFLILILIIFFLDRISKNEILDNYSQNKYFVNQFINFDLIWNTGIGFGLLSVSSSIIYNLVTLIIAIVIISLIYISLNSSKLDKIIYCTIIGGAMGNFYDRLKYNAVPDFIDIHYNNFHWFSFNVADIFISLGIIIFLFRGFFIKN